MSYTLPTPPAAPVRAEKQVNFKVDPKLLAEFDAVCIALGVSRTEQITRLMDALRSQKLASSLHHLDGSICPLAATSSELGKVIRSQIMVLFQLAKTGALGGIDDQ